MLGRMLPNPRKAQAPDISFGVWRPCSVAGQALSALRLQFAGRLRCSRCQRADGRGSGLYVASTSASP